MSGANCYRFRHQAAVLTRFVNNNKQRILSRGHISGAGRPDSIRSDRILAERLCAGCRVQSVWQSSLSAVRCCCHFVFLLLLLLFCCCCCFVVFCCFISVVLLLLLFCYCCFCCFLLLLFFVVLLLLLYCFCLFFVTAAAAAVVAAVWTCAVDITSAVPKF